MWQFLIGLLISVFIGFTWDNLAGKSFFIGVLLDVIPSVVFTLYAFRFTGARKLQMVAASFYRGETVKIMLTGAMFIAVIKTVPVIFPVLFIGFLIAKLSQFLKSIIF
ncbi:ATP synthase subunit I [Psychrosphaera sp. F3M07]|uniref:ATP synthase subunit I n=1 Tax=Psychrosphaera sp. F3M07 TaxID=2841560 RepID=UPI001C07FC7D|nr:ATP synthase subunit I [Psychrosphaera sp. F3M07]MBU2918403.1 ATP synthase subunit I [Psychrosphaera sp. F3M07]